jgi:peptidoglycan/xylan/chitin deacetylase (PgdA/CDA1 family)
VALTFDDGLRDGLTQVVPRLRAREIGATFFVNAGLLGGAHHEVRGASGRLMTADDLRALVDAGMEVGSHAMTHRDLRLLDDATLEYEVRASKDTLEAITARPCPTFAYPFGLSDARVRSAVAAAGYSVAFGWLPGRWRPYDVPRLPAPPRHGARRLALKLTGLRKPWR